MIGYEIRAGKFGATRLDGVRFPQIVRWPSAIHEGNGTRQWIIDEKASPEQREALVAIHSGKEGGTYFEIFASMCPHTLDTAFAAIELQVDRERRTGELRIAGIAECEIEPIKNPVTKHRARIELSNGFEYKIAEMANAVRLDLTAPERSS